MHEEALLRDLRRALAEVAERQGVDRIDRVRVRIGPLSHLTESALRGRWEETVAGTPAAAARLEVETSTDVGDPRAAGVVIVEVGVPAASAPSPAGPTGEVKGGRGVRPRTERSR